MKKYYVEGNTIKLIRYIIEYSLNKKMDTKEYNTQGKIYINNDNLLEIEKQKLDLQNSEYKITEVDVSDILQFENLIVSNEEEAEELINPNIEVLITNKNKELSELCEQTIFNGIDVTLTDGTTKHFSLKIEDQMNLNGLVSQVSLGNINAEDGVPCHADGEICTMFSIADFTLIANTASAFKVQQTTYCNHLMAYVKSLTTKEEIDSVTYGQELTGEFLENYNKILENSGIII